MFGLKKSKLASCNSDKLNISEVKRALQEHFNGLKITQQILKVEPQHVVALWFSGDSERAEGRGPI